MANVTSELYNSDIILGLAIEDKPLFMWFIDCGQNQHKIKSIYYMIKAANELNKVRNLGAMNVMFGVIEDIATTVLFMDAKYAGDDDAESWGKIWEQIDFAKRSAVKMYHVETTNYSSCARAYSTKQKEAAIDFARDMVLVPKATFIL